MVGLTYDGGGGGEGGGGHGGSGSSLVKAQILFFFVYPILRKDRRMDRGMARKELKNSGVWSEYFLTTDHRARCATWQHAMATRAAGDRKEN